MSAPRRNTRVKICGITNTTDLQAAAAAGADAIGVICGVPVDSPRELDADAARELIDLVPPFVTSVLVTMPSTVAEAVALAEEIRPDVVQIHGTLDATELQQLAEDHTVMRAVAVEEEELINTLDGIVDAILLDSPDEEGGGGTGMVHDWDSSRSLVRQLDTPVILAGGLTPENVEEAVKAVSPYGVDVASGVEVASGKDHEAIRRFVTAATAPARGER